MSDIIKLDGVSFGYADPETEQKTKIFDNLSLSIEEGSFVAVLGHNGSGKSTLSRLLNGMILPDEGTVTVDGLSTADEQNMLDIRRTVGLVFQNPDNQIVSTIVEEDVAFGPENLGVERGEIIPRVEKSLKAVGMLEYRRHATTKLSGGQKQRIAIAGILAMNPRCLVLDEATAMLDPRGRGEIISIAKRLNKEQGMTVVMITHYMDEAVDTDRCIVMESGKIILDGKPSEVFAKRDIIRKTGLTLPITCTLTEALSERGIRLSGDPLDESGMVEALSKLLK